MVNVFRNFLIMLSNLQQMHLKLLQRTAEAIGDLIDNTIANRTRMSQKVHRRISQKQSKMSMTKKYLQIYIYIYIYIYN